MFLLVVISFVDTAILEFVVVVVVVDVSSVVAIIPVSYTHLTLPTILLV